jgi:putative peptide zinc metalloprotease protein
MISEPGQPSTDTAVPQRPVLAPDVQLMGVMQGTGFKDRQWLIQRGQRFIQVTELLYRVAEQVNGESAVEEIAERVTASTDWNVGADDVKYLIQTKLIPLGLVATADGSAVAGPEERSALQIGMRRRALGPKHIEPIARATQFLFAPPILIPLLLALTVVYSWLYFERGVSDAVRAALYTPGGLLLTLGLVIASGIVHEFGHAAALQYGGGKVRGMGIGFYLVYPTFYTDTTDAYRLNRWSRLRTDLGGIYFHLLFGLVLIALYFLTHQEIMLAAVLVITGDILYQLVPYVRLDGYWALADLTGIPDLFSQMRPFLKSILPHSGPRDVARPQLQPWVKLVFGLYTLLVIPTLILLGVLFLTGFPYFAARIVNPLLSQLRIFWMVQEQGDVLSMAAVASQIAVLALSLLAMVYFLYSLLKKPVKALWSWSQPTLARRAIGAVTAIAAVAVLAGFWLPRSFLPDGPLPPGVQAFEVRSRNHVTTPVSYPQSPPVGGDHAPIWQNCGFYDAPIANENGVHSLEHGAVWITYRPDLPQGEVEYLHRLAHRERYVLVSPYPGLSSPLVASAWKRQARLASVDDPLLEEFIHRFRFGRQAPESGGPCTRGVGKPE